MLPLADSYLGYELTALPRKTERGRWAVAVKIVTPLSDRQVFKAEDGISYILEEEAAKECINLGRNLIDRGMV